MALTMTRRVTQAYQRITADTQRYKVDFSREQLLSMIDLMPLDEITLPSENVARITELLLTGTRYEDQINQQINEISVRANRLVGQRDLLQSLITTELSEPESESEDEGEPSEE